MIVPLVTVPVVDGVHSPASAAETAFSRSTTPRRQAVRSRRPVELGMKFRVKAPGRVVGMRFYRARSNRGTHTGSLWTGSGRRLARVTFPTSRKVGWESVRFRKPVSIAAHRTYVISYFAPHGHYSDDVNAFRAGFTRGHIVVPRAAGIYRYGRHSGFPRRVWRNSNYYVDVRFIPRTRSSTPSTLALPRVPWYGGPSYYSRFAKAAGAGWTSPHHFPIGVWYGKPSHAGALANVGINTYVNAEHDGSAITDITSHGIDVIAGNEWTPAQVGTNTHVVGWQVSDECDMGAGDCTGGEYAALTQQRQWATALRSYHDGRFLESNWGKGVFDTYWAPTTMQQFVNTVDVSSDDLYAYTSPQADYTLTDQDCCWPAGKNPISADAYGHTMDRLRHYTGTTQPAWGFVETAMPLLTESGARTIQLPQIEGAVWNSIIHGAAGIIYFQHNNNGTCGMYSLVECSQALKDKVTQVNAEVTSLAPVINTQSYQWSFGAGLQTMLKASGGYAYIFAMTDGGTGSRTFTMPPGLTGNATVVDEGRTLPVSNGRFTDTFAKEYTHHIYRVALR